MSLARPGLTLAVVGGATGIAHDAELEACPECAKTAATPGSPG